MPKKAGGSSSTTRRGDSSTERMETEEESTQAYRSQCKTHLRCGGVWCGICGYAHVRCSGLSSSKDGEEGFLCRHGKILEVGSQQTTGLSQFMDRLTLNETSIRMNNEASASFLRPAKQGTLQIRPLPDYEKTNKTSRFGTLSQEQAVEVFRRAYQTCADWQPNYFYLPRCNAATDFLNKMSKLLDSFAENGLSSEYSLNAAMIMAPLLLQMSDKSN